MKKIGLLLIALLFLQFVLAYEISLTKEDYWLGETLQAEITGLDNIKKENIFLIRDNEKMPVIYDFTKISGKHYLYMVLPDKTGSYSIKFEEVLIDGESIGDIESDFLIEANNGSYISVNPGFVIAESGEDFSISVKNKGSTNLEVNAEYGGQSKKIELIAGQEKKLRFEIEKGQEQLKINNHNIPIITTKEGEEEEPEQIGYLEFIPNMINSKISVDETWTFDFSLINAGEEKIENITIEYPDNYNLEVEPDFIEELEGRDVIKGEISLKLTKEEEIRFEITANSEDEKNKAEIIVKIEATEEEITKPSITTSKTCSEMGGVVCNLTLNEKCVGELKWADDGRCCVGFCEIEKESSWGWLGWTIVVVVIVGVGGFILLKLKKSKTKTATDVMKERQK